MCNGLPAALCLHADVADTAFLPEFSPFGRHLLLYEQYFTF